jgi:hypothetical protein
MRENNNKNDKRGVVKYEDSSVKVTKFVPTFTNFSQLVFTD